jgi:hypothetical protein
MMGPATGAVVAGNPKTSNTEIALVIAPRADRCLGGNSRADW